MKKIGVFLSRMQPLHHGHLGIINTALNENDKLIILIGSKNKEGTIRNPLDVKLRRKILEEALEDKFGQDYKERNKMYDAVSSTKIRKAFIDGDKEYIEKSCPKAVLKKYENIKEMIRRVKENPKQDYSM